ncbi:flagellar hook-basal body complex protein [bacterium]|nr:flagellar hook-basal body complex protein [bacterium]
MMRSLFAGVSGLQNHQVKMDVIGNNIANINTVGFKSGRVTFEESLTQMLKSSTRPRATHGGINPRQVGLGASIASIDVNFNQGNLETTGVITDLAIQGSAFFVVSDGNADYYTRAGNFVVDGDGRLVSPKTGNIVQGVLANDQGEILSSAKVQGVVLPFGQKSPARATEEIQYYCNLNADTQALSQVLGGDFAMAAQVTAAGVPSLTYAGGNQTLNIEVDDDQGSTVDDDIILDQDYSSISDMVADINNQIANNDLKGEVEAKVVQNGGNDVVQIITKDSGGSNTTVVLTGAGAIAALDFTAGTSAKGLEATTLLNDMPMVGNDISVGDKFNIAGVNPDGTVVSSTYIYAAGDDVAALITALNSAFSGATATVSSTGQIEIKDAIPGDSNSVASLTFLDEDSNGSSITLPGFNTTQAGRDAGTHSASITVFDSKGGEHTVAYNMVNVSSEGSPNIWSWEVTVDNGDIIPTTGNKGSLHFNNDGSLAVAIVDSGQPLTFTPGGGADTMTIDLDAGDSGTFGGITQLDAPTTTVAKHQDGYGMGNLQTISIDEQGEIAGHFSNGISQTLAQIVLASFNNPAGLTRSGDNMYIRSANSGTPVKGRIGAGIQGSINSGALEMSNVDLAKEFTDMIVAQRGFQANSRVITTSDTLLQEIVQLKR